MHIDQTSRMASTYVYAASEEHAINYGLSVFLAICGALQQQIDTYSNDDDDASDVMLGKLTLTLIVETSNSNILLHHFAASHHALALQLLQYLEEELQQYKERDVQWELRDSQWEQRDKTWQERDEVWKKREGRWMARDRNWQRLMDEAQRKEVQLRNELQRQQAHMERMTLRMRRLQLLHQLHLQQQMMQQGTANGSVPGPDEAPLSILDELPLGSRPQKLRAWNSQLLGNLPSQVPGLMINARPPTSMYGTRPL